MNFNMLKLKKLIATSYSNSPIINEQLCLFYDPNIKETKTAWKIEINKVSKQKDGGFNINDKEFKKYVKFHAKKLKSDGDFRSDECIELLKQADIVCTNPPFSLFREYIAQLIQYKKKFLVIGHINAISYKEIFPLIKDNKLWIGVSIHSGDREFKVPNHWVIESKSKRIDNDRNQYVRVPGVRWFTNLDNKSRNEEIPLFKKYNKNYYQKYDNYDAINIDKVVDIPDDYYDAMGVPISFLDKYNPNQFEIIGQGQGNLFRLISNKGLSKKFCEDYKKSGQKGCIKENHPVLGYYNKDNKPIIPYMRILIKRRK